MKRGIYILILILSIVACEEIYRPDIDEVDEMLVVEAIIRADKTSNTVKLYKSKNFNASDESYPVVTGANVYLTDDSGTTINCPESTPGVYLIQTILNPVNTYQLHIQYDGEEYISDVQQVPPTPTLDSVYGQRTYKVFVEGTANNSDNIVEEYGLQLYADIKQKNELNHYRFYGRKVIQYIDTYDTMAGPMPLTLPIFIWHSIPPLGTFNIAGPPEYATKKDIEKHPLEFFKNNYFDYFPDTMSFAGWIYIIEQFGINENSYNYYQDLNQQLGTEGRIFDPVYVQLQGNITCTTSPDKVVLGNFEITSYLESRFFVTYSKTKEDFRIKKIPYHYNIPSRGYIKNNMPDFWESLNKTYPNE